MGLAGKTALLSDPRHVPFPLLNALLGQQDSRFSNVLHHRQSRHRYLEVLGVICTIDETLKSLRAVEAVYQIPAEYLK